MENFTLEHHLCGGHLCQGKRALWFDGNLEHAITALAE